MPTVELILPTLYKEQIEIRDYPARFKVVCCGRRFGKDVLGIDAAIEPALSGYPVGWFSPTYKMMIEVWRELVDTLFAVIARVSVQERRIELVTKGVIELWSLDQPNSARGRKYKRAIINEAAMITRLQESWQEVIRPTLTDYQGDAYFLSTPKGAGFFRDVFNWGQDGLAHPEWKSWQMPTSTNPHISKAEIEAAREELPERVFLQEYLAQFLEGGGSVFRRIKECATIPERLTERYYLGRYVAGVDWGQQNDFTVVTIMDAANGRMVDYDRFNKIDWAFQRARLKTICDKWQVQQITAEKNSIGGPNIEALQREGLPVIGFDTTATSKPPLIESLALAFEKGEIQIINDPVLIGELEAYERTVSPQTGRSRYNAPPGLHDDFVVSLALAWHSCTSGIMEMTGDLEAILSKGYI